MRYFLIFFFGVAAAFMLGGPGAGFNNHIIPGGHQYAPESYRPWPEPANNEFVSIRGTYPYTKGFDNLEGLTKPIGQTAPEIGRGIETTGPIFSHPVAVPVNSQDATSEGKE